MRLTFVLPGRSHRPSGGFKVVYEYANRLVARGHGVTIVHPWNLRPGGGARRTLESRLWIARLHRRPRAIAPWFDTDPRVELLLTPDLVPERLPSADATIATAWQTAEAVAAATATSGGGFYFIQGHEIWQGDAEVSATWRLPLHKIVISRWLEEIAIEIGEGSRTDRVPNALDFDEFALDEPPASRSPRIAAIAGAKKGVEDLAAALALARAEVPHIGAVVFGTSVRPTGLPGWVEYVQQPSQRELRRLYNSCAIFVQASRSEGWGLPATEAMACGCALVTYENGGSREYAIDGETALVTARHDPRELGAGIVKLACDPDLRLSLAERGREYVGAFTWNRSIDEMERVLAANTRRPVAQ